VPGILLITAIFGVDQEMRELADAWASDGFVVSVPDIFWRQIPGPTADMTVAFDRYGKFDPVAQSSSGYSERSWRMTGS
jgi:dienelactone hydrolase